MEFLSLVFAGLVLVFQYLSDDLIKKERLKRTLKTITLLLGVLLLILQFYVSHSDQKELEATNIEMNDSLDSLKKASAIQRESIDSLLAERKLLSSKYDSLVMFSIELSSQNFKLQGKVSDLTKQNFEGFVSTLSFLNILASSSGARVLKPEGIVALKTILCENPKSINLNYGGSQEEMAFARQIGEVLGECNWKIYPVYRSMSEHKGILVIISSIKKIPLQAIKLYYLFTMQGFIVQFQESDHLKEGYFDISIGYL